MENVSKPYGTVTSNCVELVGKETVSVSGTKGFRFKPGILPTVNPDKGLTVTFWLNVERFTAEWCVLFHCGPDPHRTPSAWFLGISTRVNVCVSTTSDNNEGTVSSANVFQRNTWHHGAYILEGNNLSFYVDGKKVVAYELLGKPVYSDGTHPFFLGHDTQYRACHGQFKSVRFYNFALTRLGVKKDMQSVDPVSEAEGTLEAEGTPEAEEIPEAEGMSEAEETLEGEGSPEAEETPEAEGTLEAEGTPEAEETPKAEGTLEGSILSSYESLVDDPSHSDVTFHVDGANIHGHRCILSAHSPYFQQLLGDSMQQEPLSEITIKGVSADTFLALLRYVYMGRVPSDPEEAVKLMAAANHLSFERKLADQCRDTLAVKLTKDNASQLLRVADRFGQESLKDLIMSFMSRHDNFTSLVNGDELYMLPRPLLRQFFIFINT